MKLQLRYLGEIHIQWPNLKDEIHIYTLTFYWYVSSFLTIKKWVIFRVKCRIEEKLFRRTKLIITFFLKISSALVLLVLVMLVSLWARSFSKKFPFLSFCSFSDLSCQCPSCRLRACVRAWFGTAATGTGTVIESSELLTLIRSLFSSLLLSSRSPLLVSSSPSLQR